MYGEILDSLQDTPLREVYELIYALMDHTNSTMERVTIDNENAREWIRLLRLTGDHTKVGFGHSHQKALLFGDIPDKFFFPTAIHDLSHCYAMRMTDDFLGRISDSIPVV